MCEPATPEHEAYTEVLLIYPVTLTGENIIFLLSQKISIVNSFLVRRGTCVGPVPVVTISVSSQVYDACCICKMLLPGNYPLSLALFCLFFRIHLRYLKGGCGKDIPFKVECSKAPPSLLCPVVDLCASFHQLPEEASLMRFEQLANPWV